MELLDDIVLAQCLAEACEAIWGCDCDSVIYRHKNKAYTGQKLCKVMNSSVQIEKVISLDESVAWKTSRGLISIPQNKWNMFVFTLPINLHVGRLEHIFLQSIIFLITSGRSTLPDWVFLSFNCLGTLRRQEQPYNPALCVIHTPHTHTHTGPQNFTTILPRAAGQTGWN